ncbi:hypothetical protein NPIL_656221 [Nephila pilipes]|uniref:Uncharacterized protein n=1 Tax=Nephila pilipes TaxID=299642 RepID=A0A8X6P4Q0_NEPPI|nr:hypothetical protein NPIL_656221 [Nephila pilipes]
MIHLVNNAKTILLFEVLGRQLLTVIYGLLNTSRINPKIIFAVYNAANGIVKFSTQYDLLELKLNLIEQFLQERLKKSNMPHNQTKIILETLDEKVEEINPIPSSTAKQGTDV